MTLLEAGFVKNWRNQLQKKNDKPPKVKYNQRYRRVKMIEKTETINCCGQQYEIRYETSREVDPYGTGDSPTVIHIEMYSVKHKGKEIVYDLSAHAHGAFMDKLLEIERGSNGG